MKILEISHLSYSYGREEVLKDISLTYDNREFLAIIGPNGGGKSTLIKLILGLLPHKNAVRFHQITPRKIAYVPQNTACNPNFSLRVLEVVLMGLVGNKLFGFYTKEDRKKALLALEKVGIQELWDKKISSLSGGQRQRVFIARALVNECFLLILDEPTASVDTKATIQIFDLLATLHQQNIGIIVVCHDINIVLAYADKIAYLNKKLCLHTNQKNKLDSKQFLHNLEEHFCDIALFG